MPELSFAVLAGLALVGFVAGFCDAIAGGGGLLTLPALLLAGLPPYLALGTNKGQSVFGSGSALVRFARSPLLHRGRAPLGFVGGIVGAAVGVQLVTRLPERLITGIVMTLLAGVAVFLVVRPLRDDGRPARARGWWLVLGVALALGAYDGFFGPGMGTFLIMAFALLWHDRLDAASANAKVVNFASNLGSMLVFASKGLVIAKVALPMGAGQLAGSWLGAHLTVRRGQPLVRGFIVLVSLALVVRLAFKLAG